MKGNWSIMIELSLSNLGVRIFGSWTRNQIL